MWMVATIYRRTHSPVCVHHSRSDHGHDHSTINIVVDYYYYYYYYFALFSLVHLAKVLKPENPMHGNTTSAANAK